MRSLLATALLSSATCFVVLPAPALQAPAARCRHVSFCQIQEPREEPSEELSAEDLKNEATMEKWLDGDDENISDYELNQLGADEVECTGRVVTKLTETGGDALPDRFMMAMQAIRGEFTPEEGTEDTENADDAITNALTTFPAVVAIKVVTRPLEDPLVANELVNQLKLLASTIEGASDPAFKVTERGLRRSIGFELKVPDAGSLATLRSCLKDDPRVHMVF